MRRDFREGKDAEERRETRPEWTCLPKELLFKVFQFLSAEYLVKASQVCQLWNSVGRDPLLWRSLEIDVGSGDAMPEDLVRLILDNHGQHLRSVVFKTDSSKESAERVCRILKKLVRCSLRTLALVSCAGPVFLDIDHESFTSALTLVFDRATDSIRDLVVDYTPIDDPSLRKLARNHSNTLQRLKMKSCPRLSPEGVLALTDRCRRLRELSLDHTLLSDDILLSLSSEQHARLTQLRIDVFTDHGSPHRGNKISTESWRALVEHSPGMNLVVYFYVVESDAYDLFFRDYTPVTHAYFCENVPRRVLRRLPRNCPRLRELVVNGTDGARVDSELVDLALSCPELSSIGLSDVRVACSAFVEFVRISRERLTELFVSEECLVRDAQYDLQKVITSVSQLLSTDWEPEFTPLW